MIGAINITMTVLMPALGDALAGPLAQPLALAMSWTDLHQLAAERPFADALALYNDLSRSQALTAASAGDLYAWDVLTRASLVADQGRQFLRQASSAQRRVARLTAAV